MIVIVDYGVGNLGSILNMLKRIGKPAIISSAKNDIQNAEKLILPGVGSFDYGMEQLAEYDLIGILNDKVLVHKTPVLGICLGVQLFARSSEEGQKNGLGWIDMDVVRFNKDQMPFDLKIPHMGWSDVSIKNKSPLFKEMFDEPRFYFVHSFHMKPAQSDDILTITQYGYEFVSAVEKENIIGVQFHPEKSHKYGMKLLQNFVDLY